MDCFLECRAAYPAVGSANARIADFNNYGNGVLRIFFLIKRGHRHLAHRESPRSFPSVLFYIQRERMHALVKVLKEIE